MQMINGPSPDPRRRWLIGLVMAATLLIGLLTGGNVDRILIAMPAWSHVGLSPWADFTRSADLGNGQILYPAMAFAGTAFSVAAALLVVRTGRTWGAAGVPVLSVAALMLVSLPFSFAATPFIQSLRRISDLDTVALEHSFVGAGFWGRFQGGLHLGAFAAGLWSIVTVSRGSEPHRDKDVFPS